MDVNCDPAATSKQPHYDPRIRFTEMFLAYAEAANEAWGPKEKMIETILPMILLKLSGNEQV